MKSTHKVALLLILKAAVMAWLLVYPAKGRAQQIRHDNASNITISGKNIIAGDKPAIELNNCINIHITLSRFTKGKGVNGIGIKLYKCTNVTIDSCNFEDLASGVLASLSTGVYIANNQMKNMLGPMPRGQFVQFIECYGAGNKITQNRMENLPGKSFPEDAINIYKSNGTADSPIEISYNWIRGGGPSKSGGGIVLGDGEKKTKTNAAICGSYQTAYQNILVNPGQYGIAIVGGHHMSLKNNTVYGKKQSFTNVGLLIWNPYNDTMHHIEASGNRINFYSGQGYYNHIWDDLGVGAYINNSVDLKLTAAILPKVLITKK